MFLALNQLPTGRRGDSEWGNENYYYLYKAILPQMTLMGIRYVGLPAGGKQTLILR